jgi:hypothetical protein
LKDAKLLLDLLTEEKSARTDIAIRINLPVFPRRFNRFTKSRSTAIMGERYQPRKT